MVRKGHVKRPFSLAKISHVTAVQPPLQRTGEKVYMSLFGGAGGRYHPQCTPQLDND